MNARRWASLLGASLEIIHINIYWEVLLVIYGTWAFCYTYSLVSNGPNKGSLSLNCFKPPSRNPTTVLQLTSFAVECRTMGCCLPMLISMNGCCSTKYCKFLCKIGFVQAEAYVNKFQGVIIIIRYSRLKGCSKTNLVEEFRVR